MSLASYLMDKVFPERITEREQLRAALFRNSQETDKLTVVVQRASYRPDQTMRIQLNGHARHK